MKEKSLVKKAAKLGNAFDVGYACACANMLRDHDQPTMVEDCFGANFMTVQQMKSIGVDSNDIEVLTPIVNEIQRKRNQQ